jgi:glucose/arabinose dehydrogenase
MHRLSRLGRLLVVATVVTLLVPAWLLAQARPVAALEAGFSDGLVTAVASPTALAFTPDGRMLITTQSGQLRVYADGMLLDTPALDLKVSANPPLCDASERGLLGIAVDPSFATNHYIYLYYTRKTSANAACQAGVLAYNRVSRFTLSNNNVASGELVLIDKIGSPAGNHNAGDLNIGKDGFLYVTVGDGGSTPERAQQLSTLNGKVLRITTTGGIPLSNPHTNPADSVPCALDGGTADTSKKCREIFAYGFRNPFRFAFDPNAAGTRFFINDVGQSAREEIDDGQANYGWNLREGICSYPDTGNCGPPPAGMTNPIHDYDRSAGCVTITGGAFVPNGLWTTAYDGVYLFSDFGCGTIFALKETSPGVWSRSNFETGLGEGSAVHLRFGPFRATQALYYTTYAGGGQIRRISFQAASPFPSASPAPVTFSDVPPGRIDYEAITALAARGIVKGYGDGRFGPDDISLRAQMAAMIVRAMGWSGEIHDNPFPDRGPVDDELWADVATLAARHVALGYEDGTYNPTGEVLHLQVISFISRAMVEKGLWTAATTDDPTIYPDVQVALPDRLDLVTYVRNAGAVPDRPEHGNWPEWNTPASRGWFAQVLWQALMP